MMQILAPALQPSSRRIAYTLEGPEDAPVVVLSNSLGTTMDMWQPQAQALARRFRVLRYDTRGHGSSGLHDGTSAYTLDDLGGDVLRLLDGLGIEQADFCGISMGGITALWLAVHAPGRLRKLVVANSAACIGTSSGWRERAAQVRAHGMDGVADGAAGRWFTPDFRAAAPEAVRTLVDGLRATPPGGYAACCEALAEADLRPSIAAIRAPTLLIAGSHDPVTTVADAHEMRESIPHSQIATLDASHLSNIEAEAEFTRQLLVFL